MDGIEVIRAEFGFRLNPMDMGDGGVAFLSFLSIASGETATGRALQHAHFVASGKEPAAGRDATNSETGEFIDWLIENYWGEASDTGARH